MLESELQSPISTGQEHWSRIDFFLIKTFMSEILEKIRYSFFLDYRISDQDSSSLTTAMAINITAEKRLINNLHALTETGIRIILLKTRVTGGAVSECFA